VRILLVEDEAALRDGLTDLLAADGHDVEAVGDGVTAAERATAEGFDLLVLDLMLPRLDGFEVCRRVRAARPSTRILMLTALASENEKVRGLLEGADDYVTKPFGARELLARVRALGRRVAPEAPEQLVADGCELDFGRMVATRDGQRTALTAREVGMLRWLSRHAGRVVSRAEMLEHVWAQRGDLRTRAVDMAIAVLRRKVERDPARPRIIVSVKGAGYAWGLESEGNA
jgi:two-component system response regulator RegX3